jgi:hypothetical protein
VLPEPESGGTSVDRSTSASASSIRRRCSARPHDLLGRGHGQVGHLLLDRVQRLARLGPDLVLGLAHQPVLLGLELGDRGRPALVAGTAGVLDDLARLPARLGQLLAVLGQRLLRLGAGRLGRVEVGDDRLAAGVDHLLQRAVRVLAQDDEHDHERHQRPDHQPRGRGDQRRVVEDHAVLPRAQAMA